MAVYWRMAWTTSSSKL